MRIWLCWGHKLTPGVCSCDRVPAEQQTAHCCCWLSAKKQLYPLMDEVAAGSVHQGTQGVLVVTTMSSHIHKWSVYADHQFNQVSITFITFEIVTSGPRRMVTMLCGMCCQLQSLLQALRAGHHKPLLLLLALRLFLGRHCSHHQIVLAC